jgi:hypothetical protein
MGDYGLVKIATRSGRAVSMAKREMATVLRDYKNAVSYWRKVAGKLAMENAALRKQCEWQPSQTAPTDGSEFLCLELNGPDEGRAHVVGAMPKCGMPGFYDGDVIRRHVEWWMAIPADPRLGRTNG